MTEYAFYIYYLYDFYPSISESLLHQAIEWAKQYSEISDQDIQENHFYTTTARAQLGGNAIDVRGAYVTPELNNELQCNVGNMWEKFTLYICSIYMH